MKELLKNKYARWVILGVIVLIALYFFSDQIKDWYRQWQQSSADQDRLDEMDDRVDFNNLTYTSDTYQRYADKIQQAIGWWTNEARIYDVFNDMETNDDVEKLIAAFGRRESGTLSDWLYKGLDTGEVNDINKILKTKNIGYKF